MQPAARGPAAARRPPARAPTAGAPRTVVAKGFGTEGPPAPSGGGEGGRGPTGGGERTVGFRGDIGRGPLEGLSPAKSPGSPALAERLRALDAVLALEEALDAGSSDAGNDDATGPGSLSNHDWSTRGRGAAGYADPADFEAFDEGDYVAKQPGLLTSGMADVQFAVFLALILPPVFLLPFSIVSAAHGGPDGAFHALQEALSFAFAYKPLDL